jgi:nitroreductase
MVSLNVEMTEQQRIRLENIANTDHEIFALLKQRYSPRIFREIKIRDEHLKQLFEAVRWSPSSANQQPWRFIYAEKGSETYEKIYACLTADNQRWATNAPLLMISVYKEQFDDGTNNEHAMHDLGVSLGCMTIQAQYLGIGVHHMAGFDGKKAKELNNIPDGYHLTSTIALGYFGGDLDQLPEDLREGETGERRRMKQENFAFRSYWKN